MTAALAPGRRPLPPQTCETGQHEFVVAYAGQVTRIKARFGNAGQHTSHCHIVEHEDDEMLQPFRVGLRSPDGRWRQQWR